MSNYLRSWIAFIVGVLVILAVMTTLPKLIFAPQGLVLPAEKPGSLNLSPQNIALYATSPFNFQTLGEVHITMHFSRNSVHRDQLRILKMAKILAAQVGANAIVVKLFAHTVPGSGADDFAKYVMWGVAIHTSENSQILIPPLVLPEDNS